jgi:peptide/nickel transport system ATP-binding protein
LTSVFEKPTASPTRDATLLELRQLVVEYGVGEKRARAVDGVDLAIHEGEVVGLAGESGCGKTTIANAVMQILRPPARIAGGSILFGGEELLGKSAAELRRFRWRNVSMVLQSAMNALNPVMRVGDQFVDAMQAHERIDRRRALMRAGELLELVGIDRRRIDAYPHELSGGMRQRALIAGALAAEPDLIILDEPTTALDVTIEAQILDLLEELQTRRGLTMLFISHNLGVVRRIADEVAVLYAGQVVEEGATERVLNAPVHPYTKGLLAAIPRLGRREARLASIPGRLPDLRDPPAGCRFLARCPFAVPASAAPQMLRRVGDRIVRCCRAEELPETPWPRQAETGPPAVPAATAAGEPIVVADALSKTFTLTRGLAALSFEGWRPVMRPVRVKAIDEVSLAIAPGEVLGLVGESGSGKTTLGRTILRLVETDRGEIRIAGNTVSEKPQSALEPMRRAAQIVFQNPDSSLNPRKTVRELIGRPIERFRLAPSAEVPARVRALLDLVRLPAHYADRYPHQMSGGEKQRVGIARALATEPRFIVCDEPVSALDVSVQAAIINLLADLRDRLGVAYLFISHDISVVAHLADRVAVMYRGRIVETGPTDSIMRAPSHPYTVTLLSAVPTVDGPPRERKKPAREPRVTDTSPA